MLRYIQQVRILRFKALAAKAKAELIQARALSAHNEAALAGCQVVPPGHALVRPAGYATSIDIIPRESVPPKAQQSQPAQELERIDIIAAMSHPGRAYAVIGPQQCGKTHLVRHVMASLARQGRQIIVIGPKVPPGEWGSCCEIYGPEWSDVKRGLEAVAKLAKQRRENASLKGVRTQSFEPVHVVIDDWTETASELGIDAGRMLTSATTMFASCMVIPTFIGHANTVASWGNRIGKSLTDNFLRVQVVPSAQRGLPDPSKSTYGVIFPGNEARKIRGEWQFDALADVPSQDPAWPGHTEHETSSETCDETWEYEAETPDETRDSSEFQRQVSPQVSLPAPGPTVIEVEDRGKWRQFQLNPQDYALARQRYAKRRQLKDVSAGMKSKVAKGVALTLAKALVGIGSPKYRIITP